MRPVLVASALVLFALAGCDLTNERIAPDAAGTGDGGGDAVVFCDQTLFCIRLDQNGCCPDHAGQADCMTPDYDCGEGMKVMRMCDCYCGGNVGQDAGVANDVGTPDGPVLRVSGKDDCLAYDFAVDKGVAVYGSNVYFLPRVTNTCAAPWTFTGGCFPLKAAVLTHGVPFDRKREWGLKDGVLYLELPAGDCGAMREYAYQQGETCEYKDQPERIYWDPQRGDNGVHDSPVPVGWYDVHLLSYGRHCGPSFSKTLLVEVKE